jgi:hypothetical protein
MTSPLLQSSQIYRDSIDLLLVDHQWATVCWQVEEVIELGLGLFSSFERLDARWRDGLRRGDARLATVAKDLHEICASLITSRQKVIGLIDALEREGYVVESSTLFRASMIVPFDDRPLNVQFTDAEFAALSKTEGPKAPETVCAADDDL